MRKLIGGACLCASMSSVIAVELPSDAAIAKKIAEQRKSSAELLNQVGGQIGGGVSLNVPEQLVKTSPRAIEEVMANMEAFKKPVPAKNGDDLIVFVSLSMPVEVLQELGRQAKEAGGILLLRGLKDNSMAKTMQAVSAINKPVGVEWEINPALFKTFKVETVPTIALADASKVTPSEEGCAPDAAFDSVSGEVSVEQALKIIKSKGNPAVAALAEARLKKIHAN